MEIYTSQALVVQSAESYTSDLPEEIDPSNQASFRVIFTHSNTSLHKQRFIYIYLGIYTGSVHNEGSKLVSLPSR